MQVLESWVAEHDRQPGHGLDGWPLDVVQVFPVDLCQVGEDSQEDLVEVLQLGLLYTAHYWLVVVVFELIERVLVEAEGGQTQRVVPTNRFEYASEGWKLVGGHVEFAEGLTAL